MEIALIICIISVSLNKQIDNANKGWSNHLFKIVDDAKKLPRKVLAVAGAEEGVILHSCVEGYRRGYIQPILIGDEEKIKDIARHDNLDISQFKIDNIPDHKLAALRAVKYVADKEAQILMKGTVSASDFISSISEKEFNLLDKPILSHVEIAEIEGIEQLLILTDGAVHLNPTLEDKVHIINNAVDIGKAIGMHNPKVAVLAATEIVNPKIQSTLDAQELVSLNEKGTIKDCMVYGPLSLDMAISLEACQRKLAFGSRIKGDADILLFPNIESHSMAWKFIIYTSRHLAAHMLVGAKIPIIMTGRADDIHSHIHSMAIGSILFDYLKK